jgi:alpha-1,3-rhamnosyltransferase
MLQADNLPKISILIPSYNHADYIEQTIRSVWKQDYRNLELIVVDDGSTDNSREVIAKLVAISPIEMIVIESANGGPCRALNRALAASSGKIIGMLASDDLMLPNRINSEVIFFRSQPILKVLFSNGHYLLPDGTISGDLHKHLKPSIKDGVSGIKNHILTHVECFYTQAMLIKRDFLLDLDGFDEETGSDDWSLVIRIFNALSSNDEFKFIDGKAFLYRVHQGQSHQICNYLDPIKRKVIRKYWSLNSRSKYLCKEHVKQAFREIFNKHYSLSINHIKKATYIGFAKGLPIKCLLNFSYSLPAFAFREFFRRLKISRKCG